MRISDWSSDVCSSDLVPHHPAGGAVEKHHRIGAKIQMKMQQLQMLKQRADVTMDDGLGQASGAGREHHPKRMIVGNMLVAEVLARHLVVRQQIGRASCRERVCQYV